MDTVNVQIFDPLCYDTGDHVTIIMKFLTSFVSNNFFSNNKAKVEFLETILIDILVATDTVIL